MVDYLIVCDGSVDPSSIRSGSDVQFLFRVRIIDPQLSPILGLALRTIDGVFVYGINSSMNDNGFTQTKIDDGVVFSIVLTLALQEGDYFLDLGVTKQIVDQQVMLNRRGNVAHIQIKTTPNFSGLVNLKSPKI